MWEDDGSDTRVRVAVRARPKLPVERMQRCADCVQVDERQGSILIGKDRRFTFDKVFAPATTQLAVYQSCVAPLVQSCFDGYNATVFAYGQTGSGKTYTMGSGNCLDALEDEVGVIPRVVYDVFDAVDERIGCADVTVRCSYIEVYNEEIRDLLGPMVAHRDIPQGVEPATIRERGDGGIVLVGVREVLVTSQEDMLRLLQLGCSARTTGSTLMNQASSRSHAIFTIQLEQRVPVASATGGEAAVSGAGLAGGGPLAGCQYITAKFHLVDLAGSERNKRTGNTGIRLKESIRINTGLLALGNVISALGGGRHTVSHVPYRQSKLTRLLQDSLGGNSMTCMIACISTADINFDESLSTLKYANRARNIKNRPVVNVDAHSAELAQLRGEIQTLQQELEQHRAALPAQPTGTRTPLADQSNLPVSTNAKPKALGGAGQAGALASRAAAPLTALGDKSNIENVAPLYAQQAQEIQQLRAKLQEAKEDFEVLSGEAMELRSERDALQEHLDRVQQERAHDRLASTAPLPKATQDDADERRRKATTGLYMKQMKELQRQLAARDTLLEQRGHELQEARDDLARDELIFAEKLTEIKALKKLARETAAQRDKLLDEKGVAEAQMAELRAALDRAARSPASADASSSATPPPAHVEPETRAEKGAHTQRIDAGTLRGSEVLAHVIEEHDAVKFEESVLSASVSPLELSRPVDRATKPSPPLLSPLDARKLQAEDQFHAQQVQYQRQKAAMDKQLQALAFNIQQKEGLIAGLVKNEQEAKLLSAQHESRMHELELQVVQKEQEIESLRYDLESLDSDHARGLEERERMREQYEERLGKMQAQLGALRRQQNDQVAVKMEKLQAKSDMKVQALEGEIARMRTQQEHLKRKMRENTDKFEELHEERLREVAGLKKGAAAAAKRIKELEAENQRQRAVLKKKEEELMAVQKKLKEATVHMERTTGSSGAVPSDSSTLPVTSAAGMAVQGTSIAVGGRRRPASAAPATTAAAPSHAGEGEMLEETREASGGDVPRAKSRRPESAPPPGRPSAAWDEGGDAPSLQRGGRTPREGTAPKKTSSSSRNEFPSRIPSATAAPSRPERGQPGSAVPPAHANERREGQGEGQGEGHGEGHAGLHPLWKWSAVQRQRHAALLDQEIDKQLAFRDVLARRDALAHKRGQILAERELRESELAALEGESSQHGQFPDPASEELWRELSERIEALDEQREYLDDGISQLDTEAEASRAACASLQQRLEGMSLEESKAVLARYVAAVVEARDRERADEQRMCELEMRLQEKMRAIEQLQNSFHMKEVDYDCRMTEIQKEHAHKMQQLMWQMQVMSQQRSFASEAGAPSLRERSTGWEAGSGTHLRRHGEQMPPGESSHQEPEMGNNEERLVVLERDCFYYKQMNRELKRKLRQLLSSSGTDGRSHPSTNYSQVMASNEGGQRSATNASQSLGVATARS
eukprot:jgi/Mesvir1/17329/Mv07723-RA.1